VQSFLCSLLLLLASSWTLRHQIQPITVRARSSKAAPLDSERAGEFGCVAAEDEFCQAQEEFEIDRIEVTSIINGWPAKRSFCLV